MKVCSSNFKDVAREGYINPECCTEAEFNEDLARVNHIVRSINRIDEDGFNMQLLKNQLTTLFNVFAMDVGVALIEFKIGDNPSLKAKLSSVLFNMGKLSTDAHPYLDAAVLHGSK